MYTLVLLSIQYETQIPFCKHEFGLQMIMIVNLVPQICVGFQDI